MQSTGANRILYAVISAITLSAVLSGCGDPTAKYHVPPGTYQAVLKNPPPDPTVIASASLSNKLTPGETEKRSIIRGIKPHFVRSGVLGGTPYRYSIWDNGHITGDVDGPLGTYVDEDPDRWVIIGEVDPMTDVRTWYIRNDGSNLMLFMDAPDRISAVCVIGADFPGKPYAVRIDGNKAIRFQDGDCKTGYRGDLLAQIISGTTVLTQYYKWPYDYPKKAEGNVVPFKHIQKLLAHLMQKYG